MRDLKKKSAQLARLVSQGWERGVFALNAAAGSAVAQFSKNRFAARILSFSGIVLHKKTMHGSVVRVAEIDDRRRTFLKYAFFGGAVFLAGKYVNPFINLLRGDTVLSEKTFQNFRVTETGKQLKVTDDEGLELLIIDKESF